VLTGPMPKRLATTLGLGLAGDHRARAAQRARDLERLTLAQFDAGPQEA
jgi:hypothetical protein